MKYYAFALVAITVLFCITGCNNSSFLKTITVSEPDLSIISDGVYRGSYTLKLPFGYFVGNPTAVVDASVSNHRYQSLEIINEMRVISKTNLRPFLDRILEQQKLNIDAESGASFTKKAVQKAIENALTK